jgi:hypothetical protein
MSATSKPKLYNPRHPERTLLYQTVAEHYETWLELASAGQFDGQGDHHTPKPFVRKAFAKYLECGIFAHGFARARCGDCGHDYFVAFSCKGRGVCPSCTTRRMVETAAHLNDHVFPRLPVRQWVLSVPKRLAVLHAARRSGAEHGAAHLSAGDCAKLCRRTAPARPICRQGRPAHRRQWPSSTGSAPASMNTSTSTFVWWTGCLRKWRARAMLMRPLESHRRVSSFTRPPASMRLPWPQCRPHCKNASCAPSLLGACWRTVTPKTCWATNTAASRWMRGCASKPTTALRWSGCCAIARVHRFPWSAYAKREANWCTAVPNSAASPPVTSVVPRQMSCTSHRWN